MYNMLYSDLFSWFVQSRKGRDTLEKGHDAMTYNTVMLQRLRGMLQNSPLACQELAAMCLLPKPVTFASVTFSINERGQPLGTL